MTLQAVTEFHVPNEVVDHTAAAIRNAGDDGYEVFVLWTGVVQGREFMVRQHHIPRQASRHAAVGACVMVGGDELHRLNVWLLEHRQTLGIQVHSHPRDAYHSETDDAHPIVTLFGGLSIVVPHFGRDGLLGSGTAILRLTQLGWHELGGAERVLLVVD